MQHRALFILAVLAIAPGCGGTSPASPAAVVDVQNASDSQSADGDSLAAAQDADADAEPASACPGVPAKPWPEVSAPDPARTKYALSLFHFNVEYVVGGLDFVDAEGKQHLFMNSASNAGWDDAKVEDYIVDQTFRPILEMYDKHPSWGVDMELQARMVEVMAQRHPSTLNLLRKMAWRGQVELISFHANDQLFLAFPRLDLHRSIEVTRAIFAKECLPLSGVVFNQEGQAGEGRQKMLVDEGYTVGVFPKNLWRYVHSDTDKVGWWPLYSSHGGDLIVGPGGLDPSAGIQVVWNFLDDGELRAAPMSAAGPLNPYAAPNAPADPARVAEFEANLAATEAQGFFMARVSDYVRHLKAKGIAAKPAPPLLDGTWQAPSTQSIHRWMGGRGVLDMLFHNEDDDAVRSGNMRARHQVEALEQLVQQGGGGLAAGTLPTQSQIDNLWRLVFRAEVSDCSGVNPWYGEVAVGLETNAQIMSQSKALWAAAQLKAPAWDLQSGKPWPTAGAATLPAAVTTVAGVVVPAATAIVQPPLEVTLTTLERPVKATWQQITDHRWRLQVQLSVADCGGVACKPDSRVVGVAFPRLAEAIEFSPGLIEDSVVVYPLSAFQFSSGEAWLPLANGLVGLGKGWYVIKHASASHLAVRLKPGEAELAFVDETVPLDAQRIWVFELLQGTQGEALDVARSLNTKPIIAMPWL